MQFSHIPYQAILSTEQRLYKEQLYKTIGQISELDEFVDSVEQELKQRFGIDGWAFTPINALPIFSLRSYLGNIDKDYSLIYREKCFFNIDLILQHVNRSDSPIFQSDVEQGLKSLPFLFDNAIEYEQLMRLNHQYEYHDSCSIPVTISRSGNRAVLVVTSRGLKPCTFKNTILNQLDFLKTFALAITEIFEKNYPNSFIHENIKKLVTLSKSNSLNTLRVMVEHDLSVEETAEYTNTPLSTVKKRLKRVKDVLRANTNHGAYNLAVKLRLIE